MEFRALSGRVAAKLGVGAPVIEPVSEAASGADLRPRAAAGSPDRPRPLRHPARRRRAGRLDRPDPRGRRGGARRRDHRRRRDARRDRRHRRSPPAPARRPICRSRMSQARTGSSSSRWPGRCRSRRRWSCSGRCLEDPAVLKLGQNVKAAVKLFARLGIRLAPIDDTMLVSYAMHSGLHSHGLDYLADAYLNHTPIVLKTLTGGGRAALSFAQLSVEEAGRHAAEQAEVTFRLWAALKPRLPFARVTRVYETMERPLVPVLAEMEAHGVRVDRQALSRLSGDFAQRMAALEEEIHRARRRAVQHRLAEAARRGAVRPDGPRRRQEGQDRRLYHRRRRAGGAGGAGPRPAGAGARLADALQAQVHLYRHAAGRDQPRDRAGAYQLPDRRGGDRAAGLDRSELAEHPGPHRRGPADPRGVRGGGRATCSSASTTARSS